MANFNIAPEVMECIESLTNRIYNSKLKDVPNADIRFIMSRIIAIRTVEQMDFAGIQVSQWPLEGIFAEADSMITRYGEGIFPNYPLSEQKKPESAAPAGEGPAEE